MPVYAALAATADPGDLALGALRCPMPGSKGCIDLGKDSMAMNVVAL